VSVGIGFDEENVVPFVQLCVVGSVVYGRGAGVGAFYKVALLRKGQGEETHAAVNIKRFAEADSRHHRFYEPLPQGIVDLEKGVRADSVVPPAHPDVKMLLTYPVSPVHQGSELGVVANTHHFGGQAILLQSREEIPAYLRWRYELDEEAILAGRVSYVYLLKLSYVTGAFPQGSDQAVYPPVENGAFLYVNDLPLADSEESDVSVSNLKLNPYPVSKLLFRSETSQKVDIPYMSYSLQSFQQDGDLGIHLSGVFYVLYLAAPAYPVIGTGRFPAHIRGDEGFLNLCVAVVPFLLQYLRLHKLPRRRVSYQKNPAALAGKPVAAVNQLLYIQPDGSITHLIRIL